MTEGTGRPILISARYENFPHARSVAQHNALLPRIMKAPRTSHPDRPAGTTLSPSANSSRHLNASGFLCRLSGQPYDLWSISLAGGLSATAGSDVRVTRTRGLNRRTRNRAVGTEHTTIAWLRPQRRAAASACIEKLARIGGHGLRFRDGATRTSDDGFEDHALGAV